MKTIRLSALWLILSVTGCASAAEENIVSHPGYVDFSSLDSITEGRRNVEINLDSPLLEFMANVRSSREPGDQAAGFISQLRRVNFRSYEGDEVEFERARAAMLDLADQLDANDWEHLLRVSKRDDYFDLYFRLSEDRQTIYGSAIMAAEPGEAVFANYVIDISVDEIELSELAILMSREWHSLFDD